MHNNRDIFTVKRSSKNSLPKDKFAYNFKYIIDHVSMKVYCVAWTHTIEVVYNFVSCNKVASCIMAVILYLQDQTPYSPSLRLPSS